MRPRLFSRGGLRSIGPAARTETTLQCGPGSSAGEDRDLFNWITRQHKASMRPRLFSRGGPERWGAIQIRGSGFNAAPALQPGRTFFDWWTAMDAEKLQCGPGSSAGEDASHEPALDAFPCASMRP